MMNATTSEEMTLVAFTKCHHLVLRVLDPRSGFLGVGFSVIK